MKNAMSVLNRFKNDEDGAALIEYTVLIGILLVGVVATIWSRRHVGKRQVDGAERSALIRPLAEAAAGRTRSLGQLAWTKVRFVAAAPAASFRLFPLQPTR